MNGGGNIGLGCDKVFNIRTLNNQILVKYQSAEFPLSSKYSNEMLS